MPGSYSGATVDRTLSISGSGRVVINGNGNAALIIGSPAIAVNERRAVIRTKVTE